MKLCFTSMSIIGYWADRIWRTLCTIEYKLIEDAKALMSAHQRYHIGIRGKPLRIAFYEDPTQSEPPPYRVLRVAGFTGGVDALGQLVSKYKRYIKNMHVCTYCLSPHIALDLALTHPLLAYP